MGRISPIKNLEQLILAFAEAAMPEARLILAGPLAESKYEERLRQIIVAKGLGHKVILAGPLYDGNQHAALDAADLFVLPSLSESFGNAAGEAVLAGVPVLLTDTGGAARRGVARGRSSEDVGRFGVQGSDDGWTPRCHSRAVVG